MGGQVVGYKENNPLKDAVAIGRQAVVNARKSDLCPAGAVPRQSMAPESGDSQEAVGHIRSLMLSEKTKRAYQSALTFLRYIPSPSKSEPFFANFSIGKSRSC